MGFQALEPIDFFKQKRSSKQTTRPRKAVDAPSWAEPAPGCSVNLPSHYRSEAVCKDPFSARFKRAYRHFLVWLLRRSFEGEIEWERFDERLSLKLDCLAIFDE